MTLREARREIKGWTQEQLEDASGVEQQNISKIELGKIADPRNSTVQALAAALGIDPRRLVFGHQPESIAS